jgi:hypothetical protein
MIVKLANWLGHINKEKGPIGRAFKGKSLDLMKRLLNAPHTLTGGDVAYVTAMHGKHAIRNAGRKFAAGPGKNAVEFLKNQGTSTAQFSSKHGTKAIELMKNNPKTAIGVLAAIGMTGGILAGKKLTSKNKE